MRDGVGLAVGTERTRERTGVRATVLVACGVGVGSSPLAMPLLDVVGTAGRVPVARNVGVAVGVTLPPVTVDGCATGWPVASMPLARMVESGKSIVVGVGLGTSATAKAGFSSTACTVANGSAKTTATALFSVTWPAWSWSRRRHAVSKGSRCDCGKAATATTASSASLRTSAMSVGSGARPVASMRTSSFTRRSTWRICQSASPTRFLMTTPCTSSLPRFTG